MHYLGFFAFIQFHTNYCSSLNWKNSSNNYKIPKDIKFSKLTYIKEADAILILNNHHNNVKGDFFKLLDKNKKLLIFDGWGQIQKDQIEKNNLWTYSTLGYMTK